MKNQPIVFCILWLWIHTLLVILHLHSLICQLIRKFSLADFDNCFSVFFHADLQTRIRRIAKIYDLTDAKAKDRIIKTDKKRSSYYNYYTSKRWGDADSYDLCIDSGKMGVDGSVELVLNAIQLKEKGYKTAIY